MNGGVRRSRGGSVGERDCKRGGRRGRVEGVISGRGEAWRGLRLNWGGGGGGSGKARRGLGSSGEGFGGARPEGLQGTGLHGLRGGSGEPGSALGEEGRWL